MRSSNIKDSELNLNEDLQFVNIGCKEDIELIKNDIVVCMANGSKKLVGKSAEYLDDYSGAITVGAFCSIFRSKNILSKYIFQT